MALNARTVSAGDALEVLAAGWLAQRDAGLKLSYMLHGRPGVGKTQVVQQLADQIGATLFDLRLTTIEPQDLRGLPYYDHAAKKTLWYRPEDLPDDPARPAVLFLDELTAAAPHVQPTVYGLLQERRVGRHVLPDNTLVVGAGNTVDDGAIAYDMGTALSDRLVHVHIRASAEDWLANYALSRGIHPAVTAFRRTRPDLLETTGEALQRGDTIAATPRSWERVSDILETVSDRRLRGILISGTVGEAIAAEFVLIADEVAAQVQIPDLLAADRSRRAGLIPTSLHGLNALVYALAGALSRDTAGAAIEVLADLPRLPEARNEPALRRLPLAELRTLGFEILIRRGLELGLQDAFLKSPAYGDYAEERKAAGLD